MQRFHTIFQIGVVVCILSCVFATPAQTSGSIDQKLTHQQLIEDVDFYVKTLGETHINPFLLISEKEWRVYVEDVKARIAKQGAMTVHEFWLLFAPLVSLIQDRHTVVVEPRFSLRNNSTKYLPVHTTYVNGKVVVTSSVADVPIARGAVITSINHVNSEGVIRKLSNYGYGVKKERMRFAGGWLWIGAAEVFGKPETFALTFDDGKNVEVKGLTLSEIAKREQAAKTNLMQTNDSPLELKFLEGNVAYLNASTFGYDFEKYQPILKDVFTRIKASGARSLIVDVRSNTGGNSMLGDALIDMFNAKPLKPMSRHGKEVLSMLRRCGRMARHFPIVI